MKVRCSHCGERVDEMRLLEHAWSGRCRAASLTHALLKDGLRPLPPTHSLPSWMRMGMIRIEKTRGKYEGEPRHEQGFLDEATEQHWVPRWVDIMVDLWSGPIYMQGAERQQQRDLALHHVKTLWTSSMKQQIVDAYREDLRAVREAPVTATKRERALEALKPRELSEDEGICTGCGKVRALRNGKVVQHQKGPLVVRVRVTLHVDVDDRIAIAALYGAEPVASRATVKAWAEATLRATLEAVRAEHDESLEPEDAP